MRGDWSLEFVAGWPGRLVRDMPLYEYYCTKCASKFELLRPMSRADEAATCPLGHNGGTRTLSVFAAVSKGADGTPPPMTGGGCACGGGGCGCGCGH